MGQALIVLRIFEKIKVGGVFDQLHLDNSMGKNLEDAHLVCIDNVAEFWHQSKTDVCRFDEDAPNIAPPWGNAFFYWRIPTLSFSDGGLVRSPQYALDQEWGAHMRALTLDSYEGAEFIKTNPLILKELHDGFGGSDDAFWLANINFYIHDKRTSLVVNPIEFYFYISRDGRLINRANGKIYMFAQSKSERIIREEQDGQKFIWHLYQPLIAISFTHCKNVELRRIAPDAKLSKKQLKRYGVPRLSYDVIDIQPMTKVLRMEGGMDAHGSLKQALHICRGHFKDYRQRGLFGKNKGLYWWDMHARGDQAHGIAKRDYTISPPEEKGVA